ncbi:MAG: methionine ABC transporter ATP-binding protein [Chloroflexi bacterium]|nr:MAG: methionine ABC transporter ATP-binding protein [Chloroflexota bacterium]
MATPLLEVKDLWVEFKRPGGTVHAVNGVSFSLQPGESLGIVGESGSGKSVTVLSVLGLIARNGRVVKGEALLDGEDLITMSPEERREVRGKDVGVIFQDPMTSLNPIMRIGKQITESMITRKLYTPKEAKDRAIDLLRRVGIPQPEQRFNDYPFQFSGGMRQRVMIALALALNPKLLVADEPTTALDVTVQAQVLKLLDDLRREMGMGMIIITHDFGVATNYCNRINVMYAGQVMESATVDQLITRTANPYTLGLLESTMEIGHGKQAIQPIPGNPPSAMMVHQGCPFSTRCRYSTERCRVEKPVLRAIEPNHLVFCHYAEEVMRDVTEQIHA